MTIERVIEYILTTPYNTNRAILHAMLEELISDNGGGGPDIPGGDVIIIYDGGLIWRKEE